MTKEESGKFCFFQRNINIFQKRVHWTGEPITLVLKENAKLYYSKAYVVPLINCTGLKQELDRQCVIATMQKLESKEVENAKRQQLFLEFVRRM